MEKSRCENCEHGIEWIHNWGDGEEYYDTTCYSCQLKGQSDNYPEICPQDKKPTAIHTQEEKI